jgi:outer membrane receptor protein involved in Fe transport
LASTVPAISAARATQQLSNNWFKEYGFPSYLDKGFPIISAGSGYSNVQGIASDPGNYEIDNTFQLSDILSWNKGRHNIKGGFEFMAPQMNLIDYNNVGGSWSFSNSYTNIGSASTATVLGVPNAATGLGWASLLMGFPSGVSLAPAVIPYQYRWKYYAGFLQDDYKVSSRLTLNLGVRYQVEVPRSEKHNNQGTFVPDQTVTLANGRQQVGYLQMDGFGGAPTTLWPTRYNDFEPRIGFAWRTPAWIPGLTVLRAATASPPHTHQRSVPHRHSGPEPALGAVRSQRRTRATGRFSPRFCRPMASRSHRMAR